MSIELENTLPSIPQIERGYAYTMTADGKKGDRLVYCNKKSVFLRSLDDLSKARMWAGEHKGNVKVAVASPNGEYFASGDDHGRMLIWGQGNYMIKSDFPINKCINAIAWGPDGKRIAVAGDGAEGMAKVVSWDTGSALGSLGGNMKKVLSVDYKKTRPYRIISGGEDMKTGYFEGPPFKYKLWNKEHKNFVNKVKFSPDGEKYASCSSDKTMQIYEAKTGEHQKTLESKENGHTGSIYSFDWSPDGAKIIACGADKQARIWNVESGEVETVFTFGKDVSDMQMCALWYKDHIMTVSLSGAINFLDPASPDKPKNVIYGHANDLTDLAIDVEGKVFYTSDVGGVVCAWRDGVAAWFTGKGHGKSIRAIALNKDKSKLASVGLDDKVRVSDCKSMEWDDVGVELGGVPTSVTCGTQSDVVVVGSSKNELVIVSGANSSKFGVPGKPTSLAFSPDEKKLAVGFDKNGVKVYDWNEGSPKLAYELKSLKKTVKRVAWTADGVHLICSGADRQVLVFNGEDQKNPTDWEFHSGTVEDHAIAPDGNSVCSVSSDLSIINWKDTVKWGSKRVKMDMCHFEGIIKCGYLDNNTLITLGVDMSIKLWKLP